MSGSSDDGTSSPPGGMGMGGRQMMGRMMERMPMQPPMGAGPGAVRMPGGAAGGPRIPMDPALPMRMMGAGPFPHGDLDLRNLGVRAAPADTVRPYRPLSGRNFYFLAHLATRAATAAPVQPAMPMAPGAPPAAPVAAAAVPVPAAPDGAKKG